MSKKVQFLSIAETHFEKEYIELRKKENRLYSDVQTASLPFLQNHIHSNEWKLRVKTCNKFENYIKKKKLNYPILDLGCGNGWFTYWLYTKTGGMIDGMDLNQTELNQGAIVFYNENVNFYYGDIFRVSPQNKYSLITLNACIQYFSEFEQLINRLRSLLDKNGEIHILDSPFYTIKNLSEAKKRTINYYNKIGYESLIPFYNHHTYEEIKKLNGIILYHPSNGIISKFKKDSPFPWIMFNK